jgi:hypothetical protein
LLVIHIDDRYRPLPRLCQVIGQQQRERTFPRAALLVADDNDHKRNN